MKWKTRIGTQLISCHVWPPPISIARRLIDHFLEASTEGRTGKIVLGPYLRNVSWNCDKR